MIASFNNSTNTQGTGTTIVTITPGQTPPISGQNPPPPATVFFNSQAVGLSEALGVLRAGFVILGNVPTTDGTFGTIGPGSIQIINRFGHVVQTLTDANTHSNLFDGPWAAAVNDQGNTAQLFVADVEGGTVTRVDLKMVKERGVAVGVKVESMTQIASGYTVQPNSSAVIVGPGGLAYDSRKDTLYVASTGDNEIFAIPNAGKTHSDEGMGTLIYQDPEHLRGPIGLALAPNGDLLTTNDDAVNGDPNQPSELIEFTPTGQFVGELSLNPNQGAAFEVLVLTGRDTITVATVNDALNTLDLRTIPM